MMKLIIGIVAIFSLLVMGLSALLTPNDLSSCESGPSAEAGCQVADAIIAVSGGDTRARAESAVELYKKGWASKIIFSGAAADPDSPSNAAVMRDLAVESGVPKEAIFVDESSKTTRENAKNTKLILDKNNMKTAILTTSPYHQRRAVWEFEQAAPDVVFRSKPAKDGSWDFWWIKPTGWWQAINEVVGISIVLVRGML